MPLGNWITKALAAANAYGGPSQPQPPPSPTPNGPASTATPFSNPGQPVGVTGTTTGLNVKAPAQLGHGGYAWAVVNNVSPWMANILCATGLQSLQPYSADIIAVSGVQSFIVSMVVPPGGSAIATPGALSYIQATWYEAGGAPPPGVYPITLTALAISAAISNTAPGAPTIGTASAGALSAGLTWSAPSSAGSGYITGYLITPYAAGIPQTQVAVGNVTSTTITGLTAFTSYTFTVQAVATGGTGSMSAPSNAVTPYLAELILVGSAYSNTGGTNTLSVSPVSAGDLLVVGVEADSATPATSLVGGGVTNWQQIGYEIQTGIGLTYYDVELWAGIVATPGASTITINGVGTAYLTMQEYSTGFTTTAFTVGQWQGTTGHSTTPGTVSLQPQTSPNELCVGMLSSGGTETFSPTTGWDVLTTLGAPLMASYRPTQLSTSYGFYVTGSNVYWSSILAMLVVTP